MTMRPVLECASLLTLVMFAGCAQPQSDRSVLDVRSRLARLERAWLDAYDNDDVAAMDSIVADGFTITFPDGRVATKVDVITGLSPGEAPDTAGGPTHYTEDVTIRVHGNTAIITGVYVNPGDAGEPDERYRYTDTWLARDGRWQVVASHLSALVDSVR